MPDRYQGEELTASNFSGKIPANRRREWSKPIVQRENNSISGWGSFVQTSVTMRDVRGLTCIIPAVSALRQRKEQRVC